MQVDHEIRELAAAKPFLGEFAVDTQYLLQFAVVRPIVQRVDLGGARRHIAFALRQFGFDQVARLRRDGDGDFAQGKRGVILHAAKDAVVGSDIGRLNPGYGIGREQRRARRPTNWP